MPDTSGDYSRRLRHPAPVLMTGAPGPVPVYRAPKNQPRTNTTGPSTSCNSEIPTVSSQTAPVETCRAQPGHRPTGRCTANQLETRTSSPRLHPENLAGLAQPRRRPPCQHTATVDLNGLLKNQTMGEASVPRLGNRRHCRGTATAAPPLYCCTQRARQPRPRAAPVESPRKVSH